MQAILLAGGLGTRLRSVVKDRPKPMAPVNDRPFLEYLLHSLTSQGIQDIIFAVGYKGSMIEEYFGNGTFFNADIHYAYEETLLGTAGAIKNAVPYVKEESVLVLNADTYYSMEYRKLFSLCETHSYEMALVLREVADVSRYGEAELRGNELVRFNEKTEESRPGTINGGVYLMRSSLLNEIPNGKVSLENEIIPKLLRESRKIGGIINDGYFIDIGVPADYFRFIEDVKGGVIACG
ncbi:MAG: NTP transferase domain-containing protein [Lachnospiraceae bacterium]|nr:NTP transferase domain-containing protein [Lachnospiraceae bacterium]